VKQPRGINSVPRFSYTAKKISGELVTDTIEADNPKLAAAKLQSLGYFPLTITLRDQKTGWINSLPFSTRAIKHNDIVAFTRRLADSLKGGLSLPRALNVLQNQTEHPKLSRLIKDISLSVQEGKSFSCTLEHYPGIFSSLYIAMVRTGEAAGVLETVLSRLADFDDKEDELRYKLYTALAYPAVMLLVGMASVIFLLSFVFPKFEIMFLDLGQSLPLPTKILLMTSRLLRYGWFVYVPLAVIGIVAAHQWRKTTKGTIFLSRLRLKLPIIGVFVRKELIARFLRMLSILLTNGVPVLDALAIARNSVNNAVFTNELDAIYASVKEGEGLAKPLAHSAVFPPLVAEMIAVGEETGNLESALVRIADIYEREVDYAVKAMTSLLEPVIILFAGVIVCFIALSLLLPVFQVSSGIH
jgi:type II secretory pathway component PulF